MQGQFKGLTADMGHNNNLFNRFLIIQKPYVLVLVSFSIILFVLLKRESLTLQSAYDTNLKYSWQKGPPGIQTWVYFGMVLCWV